VARYVLQRCLQALVVIVTVISVVFFLERLSGNPALVLSPPEASPADIAAVGKSLGLDQPIFVQYFSFWAKLVRGDFGDSFTYHEPVFNLIAHALPYTAELALAAFLFASIVGVVLGTTSALKSGSWIDTASRAIGVTGQSIPVFWLGEILILVFAAKLRLLPAFGAGTPDHLILPALALGLRPLASVTRLTRSSTFEVLKADHTQFERSKGVKPRVLLTHILRNMSLPVLTLSGIQLADLLSGSIVIETIFGWPGIGQLAINGVDFRDYTIIQAVVTVDTLIYVVLNLLVDLSYGWLDPRVRRQ
jgi:peptide/nickel transport system permease protein